MNEMSKNEFQELLDAMKKDKEKSFQKKFWSPPSDKEGTFKIRFLPPVKKNGEKVFYFRHRLHWVDGKSYECTKQTLVDKYGDLHEAEECPICKFVKKLYDTAEKESEEYKLAGSLAAKDRYVYRVVVRGKENETSPEFFESGKKLFESIYHILTETDFGNIVDLKEGRDFNLVKTGTGRRSNYDTSSPSANTSLVFKTKEELSELMTNLESMPTFNSLVEFVSADTLKNVLKNFLNGEKDDDEEPVAKEAPKPTRTPAAVTKKAEEPDVFEETSEEDEDDEVSKLLKEFENL